MTGKVIVCIFARTTTESMPIKVLRTVRHPHHVLDMVIQRIKRNRKIGNIVLCTSEDPRNDILEDVAEHHGIRLFRGTEEDGMEPAVSAAVREQADHIAAVPADHVFADPYLLKAQMDLHVRHNLDYSRTENVPIGTGTEIVSLAALQNTPSQDRPVRIGDLASRLFRPDRFACGVLWIKKREDSPPYPYNLAIRTREDLDRTRAVARRLGARFYKADWKQVLGIMMEQRLFPARMNPGDPVPWEDGPVSFRKYRKMLDERGRRALKFIVDAREI